MEAVLFEPERDVDKYFKLAENNGFKIVGAAETHIHADYLSGLREIAERGIKVYASDEGTADWKYEWLINSNYDYQLLKHGNSFELGDISFEVIHTPGHTPEHIAFFVAEVKDGKKHTHGILTGDFVFVGDVGRPDLLETAAGYKGTMRQEAAKLFESIQQFKNLPKELVVLPTHGAGSACGKSLGASPMSTVEQELKFNPSIQAASDKDEFIKYILSGQPDPPYYFARMKRENKAGPSVLKSLPMPKKISVNDILQISKDQSALVLDGRDWQEFRNGHIQNSLHAPLNSNFLMVTGSYIDTGTEIALIMDEDVIEHVVTALARIGLDHVTGYALPKELVESGHANDTIEEIEIEDFKSIVDKSNGNILDVRNIYEIEQTGKIGNAQTVAYTSLKSRSSEINNSGTVYVYCRTGNRSAYASSYLKNMGYKISHVKGGIVAWQDAGYEVTPILQNQLKR